VSRTAFWDARRNRIRTRKGGWRIGGGIRVHGHSLLGELVGRHRFTEVLFLEVTGRLPEPRLARWIEGSFLCLAFPDPRIWCNQIGALAGSARIPPTTSIAAGTMASDSRLYGPGSTRAACGFLLAAHEHLQAGGTLADFLRRHTSRGGRCKAPGFARPIARGDDRVAALEGLAAELGFEEGEYLGIARGLHAALEARGESGINMLGYVAAFLLDRGMRIEEGERLYALAVNAGVHACYSEAASEPAGAFLPMACEDVEYTGTAPRELPPEWRT
jgi:citrate synthase